MPSSNNNNSNQATATRPLAPANNNNSNKGPGVTHGHTLFRPRAVDTTDEEIARLRAEGQDRVARREREKAEVEAENRAETRSTAKERVKRECAAAACLLEAALPRERTQNSRVLRWNS